MSIPRPEMKLSVYSAVLSLLNLLIFHFPFLGHVTDNVTDSANGVLITVSMTLLLFTANYFAFYLVLYLGRFAGKTLGAISFITNAVCLYFINTYNVILDDTMMGNVFNTNPSEAGSYWSWTALAYILSAGVLPAVAMYIPKLEYGSLKRFFANTGCSLAVILAIGFGNMSNWPWVDAHATTLGALLMPWSSIVNSIRYASHLQERGRVEELLPDAAIADSTACAVIVIIGESARRDHFSLYGYQRQTNPLMEKVDALKAYKAESAATYTTEGVKAILDYMPTDKLYEVLPNYLNRCGVDVVWRTSNWGEPPLKVREYSKIEDIASEYGIEGPDALLDSTLLAGLKERIDNSSSCKVAVFLHTSTSHGPSYSLKYPARYGKYTPAATQVEMSTTPVQEVVNAYDNSILYTDAIIASAIHSAGEITGRRCCVIFVSDHGESLGENGLYMHGVPRSIAPAEQYEIPFIIWSSDPSVTYKDMDCITQYSIFHSVLHFLGISSPVYNADLDLIK